MSTLPRRTLALLAVCFLVGDCPAADRPNELLKCVPEQANAVVAIDLQALRNSPLGMRQGWGTKPESVYLGGVPSLVPNADRVVLACQLDPSTMKPSWEIGLATLKRDLRLAELGRRKAGSLDRVAGVPCLLSSRNAYVVELAPRIVGVMTPANRQALARWINFTQQNSQVVVTPYLQNALASASSKAQVVLAIDLRDSLDPGLVKYFLAGSKTLQGKGVDLDRCTRILAGIEGIRFTIRVGDSIRGELRVDRREGFGPLTPFLKPLLLEVLATLGASIPDLEDWTQGQGNSQVLLAGELSEAGARRILALIRPPALSAAAGPAGTPGETSGNPQAVASQDYFRQVTTLIDDLHKINTKNVKEQALWHEKYADEIDRLPILDVDEELLKYGQDVSVKLRALGQALRGVYTQSGLLQKQKVTGQVMVPTTSWNIGVGGYRGGYYGGYGGYYQTAGYDGPAVNVDNFTQVRAVQDQLVAAGNTARVQVWNMINNDTAAIRRKMVAKYKVDFPIGRAQSQLRAR